MSIKINDDDPGFVISWDYNYLNQFVIAANNVNANITAPAWLNTRPPQINVNSFADDLVNELAKAAGGRCGRVLLAPNRPNQFLAVGTRLVALQNDTFLQNAMHVALLVVHNVEKYLATTFFLSHTKHRNHNRTISNRTVTTVCLCAACSANELAQMSLQYVKPAKSPTVKHLANVNHQFSSHDQFSSHFPQKLINLVANYFTQSIAIEI